MTRVSGRGSVCAVIMSLALCGTLSSGQQKRSGKELFQSRCGGCHSGSEDHVGPRLKGVFGRAAGAVSTFQYSDALKSSHVVWDAATLDKWLQDPDTVVPDNDMSFRLEDKAERTAIIDYLKELNVH